MKTSIGIAIVAFLIFTIIFTNASIYVEAPTQSQKRVTLYKENTVFYDVSGPKIDVIIGNFGTKSKQIKQVRIGTSFLSLENQRMTPITLSANSTAKITLDYNWTRNAVHFFEVACETGETYAWTDRAPPTQVSLSQNLGETETGPTCLKIVDATTGDISFNFTANQKKIGDNMKINITLENVKDLTCWQIGLLWDRNQCAYVNASIPTDNIFESRRLVVGGPDASVPGKVVLGTCVFPGENPVNGSGTLVQIELEITKVSEHYSLTFVGMGIDTFLLDKDSQDIPFTVIDDHLQSGQSTIDVPERLTFGRIDQLPTPSLGVAVTIENQGNTKVIIAEVMVNGVLTSSVSPSLPITLGPEQCLIVNVSTHPTSAQSYRIGFITSNSKYFSVVWEQHQPQKEGVFLYVANTNFASESKIDIDLGNSGTQDTMITQLFIGTESYMLQEQEIAPLLLTAGQVKRITAAYNWINDEVYYFKILTSSGQSCDWISQTPRTECISIVNLIFKEGDSSSIQVTALNAGTTDVTVNEVWINNVKIASTAPQLPVIVAVGSQLVLDVGVSVTTGYSYQVKLVSSLGNQFLYTATVPT